jgi:ABC-type transport system substrate-binding protein
VAVFRLGWDPAEPQPGSYLRPLFHSSQIGVDNLTRYASEDVDRYLDEAQTAAFPTVAEAWYRQAERRVLEDLPAMPLLWYRHQRVVGPEVRDLRISPLGRMSFARPGSTPGRAIGSRVGWLGSLPAALARWRGAVRRTTTRSRRWQVGGP